MDSPIAIGLYVFAVIGIPLLLMVVTLLKGKYGTAVGGLFIPFIWLFAAIRLAKPGSMWARSFYDSEKLAKSSRRFSRAQVEDGARSPGWYPDPDGSGLSRYWDGSEWTGQYGLPEQQSA